MKKLHLFKRMLLLLALIVGCVNYGWADTTVSYGWENSDDANKWTITNTIAKTSGQGNTGTYAGYINTNHTYVQFNEKVYVTSFSFAFKRTSKNTNYNVYVETSTDGETWTAAATYAMSTFSNGSYTTKTKTFDGSKQLYVRFHCYNSTAVRYVDDVSITYTEPGTTANPSITGNNPFLENTTVTITNAAIADGADIFYTLNGDNPTTTTSANCFAYSAPFEISSTTTVKAIAKKSTDTNASSVVSKTFTKVTPMTVTAALTAIADLADNETIADQCVTGIVSTAGTLNNGAITYSVSVDGTTTNELYVYNGKGLNGANFASADDIAVGDVVVIYGTLKTYNSTPEFAAGNYLLSKVRKPAPTFSLDITEKTLEYYGPGTVDVTLTTNTDGEITCVSDNEDVATVALKSDKVYTITAKNVGTATITIRSALSANYAPASATVDITVQDSRAEAGISFNEDADETTWGESYTGQALTNNNGVAVSWSSTNEAVATVDSEGGVTILKAGETDIKATFAGNATYKAADASYTLTVNKAEAGLSYTTTSFDIMLNDASFVAPTLQNPNGLTGITYSSNNETVAIVDENTGELAYESSAVGTAKITATFAGNDWYESGSANYTINIVDPTAKGSKYNPYTVAEVNTGDYSGNNYVRGYIVGVFVGKDSQAASLGNSNIALSDSKDEKGGDKTIAVQLPSGSIRNAWNIDDNNVVGMEVLVYGNITGYFTNKTGVKSTSEISAISVPATISASGWTSLASAYDLNYSGAEEQESVPVAAYAISNIKKTSVTLTQHDAAPAGVGMILKGKPGSTYSIPVTTSVESFANELSAAVTATAVAANSVYAVSGGKLKLFTGTKVPAGKAYLLASKVPAEAHGLTLDFDEDGETTGIAEISSKKGLLDGDFYDLSGRKVVQPTKGLYIMNGKKVIIK